MFRSLRYFWPLHTAVALGFATATAILTGALIVGDSVRGSLRDLAIERLGTIDHGLVSDRFVRASMASDLSRVANARIAPAILLRGSASAPETGLRATGIQVCGVDSGFTDLFPGSGRYLLGQLAQEGHSTPYPPLVINRALQQQLHVEIGDAILLAVGKSAEVAPEFVFGSRAPQTRLLRVVLAGVVPDRDIGRFALHAQQTQPYNAFVRLRHLQQRLGRPGEVNALLAAATSAGKIDSVTVLQQKLDEVLQLRDLGLLLSNHEAFLSLGSRQFMIAANLAAAARDAASEIGAPFRPLLTYLAVAMKAGNRIIPYSTITAVDLQAGESSFESAYLREGTVASPLSADEIFLNEWAANDLGVDPGDRISVSYFVPGPGDQLDTTSRDFTLAGVVAQTGFASRRILTPRFPGLSEYGDMASWEAPFPLDTRSIRAKDEAYWDAYGATPKAFVAASTGRNLWRSRFGEYTSIWIGPAKETSIGETSRRFERALLERIGAKEAALAFLPHRQQGLEAATGATDFSALFLGFSLFLIASAMLLAVLLFGLGIEMRAPEVGYLRSAGFSSSAVRRRFVLEGGVLALTGGIAGLGLAAAYGWLMLAGLRTWWVAAVGTRFLTLHLDVATLVSGYLISVVLALLTILAAVSRLGRIPVTSLLKGITATGIKPSARCTVLLSVLCLGGGLATALAAAAVDVSQRAGLFYLTGLLVLVGTLAALKAALQRSVRSGVLGSSGFESLVRMGTHNNRRRPGRVLLCIALVSAASFILVTVGANRTTRGTPRELHRFDGGTGGFALLAEADVPLLRDLNSPDGRFELGFDPADEVLLGQTAVFSMRSLPGEDISCLNLYRPQRPRVLGIPSSFVERGGFSFQELDVASGSNPWLLLNREIPGAIPAFADFNSAQWILHVGLGDDVHMKNSRGEPIVLRIVGLLKGGVFQSELLISDAQFTRYFPGANGYSYFLVEAPHKLTRMISEIFERTLFEYGFDITPTAERISRYREVENTYLATFQILGGFGLILGTIGLGIVLWRNILERRGELAVLRACGYNWRNLTVLLLSESTFLLLAGIACGTVAAAIAVAPHLAAQAALIPWRSIFATLLAVFVSGTAAVLIATLAGLRTELVPTLKAE